MVEWERLQSATKSKLLFLSTPTNKSYHNPELSEMVLQWRIFILPTSLLYNFAPSSSVILREPWVHSVWLWKLEWPNLSKSQVSFWRCWLAGGGCSYPGIWDPSPQHNPSKVPQVPLTQVSGAPPLHCWPANIYSAGQPKTQSVFRWCLKCEVNIYSSSQLVNLKVICSADEI